MSYLVLVGPLAFVASLAAVGVATAGVRRWTRRQYEGRPSRAQDIPVEALELPWKDGYPSSELSPALPGDPGWVLDQEGGWGAPLGLRWPYLSHHSIASRCRT